jgi:integrase
MSISVGVQPKEPFTDDELDFIYKASGQISDGRGFSVKRTGTANGKETLVFAWVLRYTGLRISDVTVLEQGQVVPFCHGRYTHAVFCNPRKTKDKRNNFVHIPIPNASFPDDPDLVAALQELPLKHGRYFFLGGGTLPPVGSKEWKQRIKQATTNWRGRINRLFGHAARLMAGSQPSLDFSDRPHPHRFRHTFAATLLKAGVSLRIVAQYLGDTEGVVRDHYAKFCIAEQEEAAAILETAMIKSAEQRKARLQLPALRKNPTGGPF